MKKNLIWTLLSLMVVLSLGAFTTAEKDVNPVGTWTFTAPDAPYDYQSGDIVISKEKKEYKVQIVFNEYYKINGSNVKYEKNVLSFRVNLDDETVYIKGTFDPKTGFTGKAMTSMGDMVIKAKKKVATKKTR